MRKRVQQIGVLMVAGALSGCGTLYNAANDKAAQAAKQAFEEAGLAKALDAERTALARQQAERHELVVRSELALRDRVLVGVLEGRTADASWGALSAHLDARIAKIAGAGLPVLGAEQCSLPSAPAAGEPFKLRFGLAETRLRQEADKMKIARSQLALALAAQNAPLALSCDKPASIPAGVQDGEVALLADAYRRSCERMNQAKQCLASALRGGRLAHTRETLTELTEANAVIAADVESRRAAYRQLLNAADQGDARAEPAALAARLAAALDELENTVGLDASKAANPLLAHLNDSGRLAALTEKRALLDGYIGALAGAESPAASRQQHRVFLVSRLLNRVGGQKAPTAGILMEAEFIRQQIAAAEARLERARQAEQIYQRRQEHLLAELGWLLDAKQHISDAPPRCTAQALHASLTSAAASPCAYAASKALVAFSAAWTAGRVQVEQDDYRLIDLSEQASLEESASALAQSAAVIKTAVGQIAAVHASGVKPEDIAALAQALSLPAIAVRVQ